MRDMAKLGYVNRALESLPDDDDLTERIREKKGLTRPELAICVATVKMWMKDVILQSPLPDDPFMQPYLLDYFPRAIREKFPAEIPHHALAGNIIATEVSNLLVDALGTTFVHRNAASFGVPPIAVINCALAAEAFLETQAIRTALRSIDDVSRNGIYLELVRRTGRALAETTTWLLSAHGATKNPSELVALYGPTYRRLRDSGSIPTDIAGLGLDATFAQGLGLFPRIVPTLEMLWTAQTTGKEVALVDRIFSEVMRTLSIDALVSAGRSIEPQNRWEQEIVKSALTDIRRSVSQIAGGLLRLGTTDPTMVSGELKRRAAAERLYASIDEAKQHGLHLAALAVVAKQLRTFEL
jgi:glutamate dehydrogenase